MNWIDKAIGFVSPKRAYERIQWRNAARSYDSGTHDRLNSGWNAVNTSAEQTNQPYRDTIRARARDLERNSDIAEAVVGPFERNVVGTGIVVQAKVKKDNGEDDDQLNTRIEDVWNTFMRKENCDITGQQSFFELQAMAMRRLIVDGGIIFIKIYTDKGLQLQAREVDDLDTSFNSFPGEKNNRIVGGIELDMYGKPVAYYLKKYSVDGYWTGDSERIEAKRVIYLWRKVRPTQVREMSQLSRTMPRVRDVNEFIEALSVKERILACMAVFITKAIPSSQVGRKSNVDEKTGYQTRTISPGMIQELQPNESVTPVSPNGSSSSAKEFVCIQQRLAGSGQGLSYEAVSRDMSQVNYSSARQGLLEDQRTYGMWQRFLIEHFCREVYEDVITWAVLKGKLSIKDFSQKKERYLAHEWITPGWSWIDPLKEVRANEFALNSGHDTLARICAERGLDWREVMKQRAAEKKMAQELGIGGGDAGVKETAKGQTGTTNTASSVSSNGGE